MSLEKQVEPLTTALCSSGQCKLFESEHRDQPQVVTIVLSVALGVDMYGAATQVWVLQSYYVTSCEVHALVMLKNINRQVESSEVNYGKARRVTAQIFDFPKVQICPKRKLNLIRVEKSANN